MKAKVKKPPAEEKKARKKRDGKHNQARRRAVPTQIVEHRIVACPDCDLRLGGISLARSREVIDIPVPAPVQVIEHRIYKGWCAQCQKWHEAPVDVHEQVLGQGRIGVRLASIIAYLRTSMRLPIRPLRGGTAGGTAWATQACSLLEQGQSEALVSAIQALPPIPPEPGQARSSPERAVDYFTTNAQRMRYPLFRAQGMHIGSGIAEAACKTIVSTRAKRSGMRWTPEGLDALLPLRTAVLNDTYDSFWEEEFAA